MKYFLLVLLLTPLIANSSPINLRAGNIEFRYQSLQEPFPSFPCTHKPDPNENPYDRQVECKDPQTGRLHSYDVHLALDFYSGVSKYELLYWVTDKTDKDNYGHSSSTIWIHNGAQGNQMKDIEVSQGIEQDNAYLKLQIVLDPS